MAMDRRPKDAGGAREAGGQVIVVAEVFLQAEQVVGAAVDELASLLTDICKRCGITFGLPPSPWATSEAQCHLDRLARLLVGEDAVGLPKRDGRLRGDA